ncbi:hypothetical protein GCM10027341_02860 [Spirosoma knui]
MEHLICNFTLPTIRKLSLFAENLPFKKSIKLLDDWPDIGRLIEEQTVRY